MITGVTPKGFEFTVDEAVYDDIELLDAIYEYEAGDAFKFSEISLKILGKEQRKKLYDLLRDENGRVSIDAARDEIMAIIESSGEGKNS